MKKSNLKKLKKILKTLESVKEGFQEIADDEKTEWDMFHYANEISKLLSCDNNEAGLNSLVHIYESKS